MQISENRLRHIVREEVTLRIIKETISEVVSEMQLGLTEQQIPLFEETVLDKIKKGAKKYALPIWAVAAIGFGSEIADRESMEAEATAMTASRIKKAIKIGAEYEQARLDALKDAIKKAGLEGRVPPDLLADLEQTIQGQARKTAATEITLIANTTQTR